jgi:hypothetical protein
MKAECGRGTSFASVAVVVGALFVAVPRQVPEHARLAAEVRDSTADERVVLEAEALGELLAGAPGLDEDAADTPDFDEAARQRFVAAPGDHRGEIQRVRGALVDMQTLSAPDRSTSYTRGRLRVDSGGDAYFVAAELPLGIAAGDFVRFDGRFMKVHSRAADDGWIDAPLFVAPRLVRSCARLEPQVEIDGTALAQELDDTLDGEARDAPSDAEWKLLSYALNPASSAVDWNAARVLDAVSLAALLADGSASRGEPFRIDAARIARFEPQAPGENPLRLRRLDAGWLGTWRVDGNDTLVKFVGGARNAAFGFGDAVVARGFFLRNVAYERQDGERALAPFFVLHLLERENVAEPETRPWIVGSALALVALLAALALSLRHAARASPEIRAQLSRRNPRTDRA